MAWNEPGGDKDPWGGRGGDQGPPDLDEAFKKLQGQLSGIFGGKGGGGSGGKSSGLSAGMLFGVLLILVILYGLNGIYVVDESERGVVFRFGKVKEAAVTPGLNWYAPVIDNVELVNVSRVREHEHQALMLTEDENIVDVSLVVQWVVDDAQDFVVKVKEPEVSLDHATESALRHVVGSSVMDYVITEGRADLGVQVQQRLQNYLNDYGTGILVRTVNINETGPPREVKEAFDDVQKAKEDESRVVNLANAYAEQKLPEARGAAQQQLEAANAYRDRVIARSEGEADRFVKLWSEYSQAKKVTRDRLYLDAVETVMSSSSKVLLDVEGGNNMLYLPLDQLRNRGGSDGSLSDDDLRKITEQLRRQATRNTTSTRRSDPR